MLVATLALAVSPAAAAAPSAQTSQVGAAPADEPIELVLPLVADEAGLQRFAQEVAHLGQCDYGQYESIDALAARFGASAHTRDVVLAYLRGAGGTAIKIDRTRLFAYATLKAAAAQQLFGPGSRSSAPRAVLVSWRQPPRRASRQDSGVRSPASWGSTRDRSPRRTRPSRHRQPCVRGRALPARRPADRARARSVRPRARQARWPGPSAEIPARPASPPTST